MSESVRGSFPMFHAILLTPSALSIRQAQVAYTEAAKSWENLADASIWWETAIVRVRFGDYEDAAKILARIIRDFPMFESLNQVIFMSAAVLQ